MDRSRHSEGSAAGASGAVGMREQVKATVKNVLRRKREEDEVTPRNFARRQYPSSVSGNEDDGARWKPFSRRHHVQASQLDTNRTGSVWKKAIHKIQGNKSADSDLSTKATDSRLQSNSPPTSHVTDGGQYYNGLSGASSTSAYPASQSIHTGSSGFSSVARVAAVSSQGTVPATRATIDSSRTLRSRRYYTQATPQHTRVRGASRPATLRPTSVSTSSKHSAAAAANNFLLTEKGTPADLTRFFDPMPWPANRFQRLQRLAPAIHGEVSLYHDSAQNRKVVVKQLANSSVRPRGPQELENPLVEIGAMSYLFSDRAVYPVDLVAHLEGVYRDDHHTYLVTEYCTEGELFKEIVKRKCLSERHVKAIALQLALALHALHKNGICHRDVSLENTLIQSDHTVRLIDFGQAECCHEPDGSLKLMHGSAGKTYYRAPEMLRGPYYGPPVDVFALGVQIFIMAIGSPPWAKASLQDQRYRSLTRYRTSLDISLRKWGKRDGLSDAFVDILSTIFTSNPQQRPTIEQLLCHPWFSYDASVWTWVDQRGVSRTIREHAVRVEMYLKSHPQGEEDEGDHDESTSSPA